VSETLTFAVAARQKAAWFTQFAALQWKADLKSKFNAEAALWAAKADAATVLDGLVLQ
jgi:hypothetical protein